MMPSSNKPDKTKSSSNDLEFSESTSLLGMLKLAAFEVPAVKYAIGVLGIVSATVIIRQYGINYINMIFAVLAMIFLMVILLIFESLTKSRSTQMKIAGHVLAWAFLIFAILISFFTLTSTFFDWPKPMEKLLRLGNGRATLNAQVNNTTDDTSENQDRMKSECVFSHIEIVTSICWWEPLKCPWEVTAPIRGFSGEYWNFGGHPIGTPRQNWKIGSHQKWPIDAHGGKIKNAEFIEDPVFDITLVNRDTSPVILSRLGVLPIAAWTSPKGPPYSGKITNCDGYSLTLNGFESGVKQWLILDDPVYIAPKAPYRFRLRLINYKTQVNRNESALQFMVQLDRTVSFSEEIYLGMY